VSSSEFEERCEKICANCRRAATMAAAGEKGHTLRYRKDTDEFVHDFWKGVMFSHAYCLATRLRNGNGRP
jgi:hypothetical protein